VRILWIDIDTLRPDHLGCYGYHRNTSPNIDALAAEGIRFDHCHVPDAPCLPSRAALVTGRFGIHNGAVGHGGTAADMFLDGSGRGFRSGLDRSSFMSCLRRLGLRTVSVSPFGERHSAWWWYAGFNEAYNTGKGGMESAEEISPVAMDWIKRNGRTDNWFMHVNYWDPHAPFRAPAEYGEPFAKDPLPAWLTEEVRCRHWEGCGPHSAREPRGFGPYDEGKYPRSPVEIDSMAAVRKLFDGYDTGIRYADDHAGRLLNALADAGVQDDTIIIVSSDHGENQGELNIYADHHTADEITSRVPFFVRWPGMAPMVDRGLHYQIDLSATLVEMLGGRVPENWDGKSLAAELKAGRKSGRERLVLSQCAWSCQRSIRWGDYIAIRSYHDGYHCFPEWMVFDVKKDPHETEDLAPARPDLVKSASEALESWTEEMLKTSGGNPDPMRTVLTEGGPYHCRGELAGYLKRLEATGRGLWAERLRREHPGEP
jgi:arylsulfatase A-like enzyme